MKKNRKNIDIAAKRVLLTLLTLFAAGFVFALAVWNSLKSQERDAAPGEHDEEDFLV